MSISPCGSSIFNYSTPYPIELPKEIQGKALPYKIENDISESSVVLEWSDDYPFQSIYLPFDLARETRQKLLDFGNDIFGLILTYPHGFDDDPIMCMSPFKQSFLHLFNAGESSTQYVSGTVDKAAFTNIEIFPKKRVSLNLSVLKDDKHFQIHEQLWLKAQKRF